MGLLNWVLRIENSFNAAVKHSGPALLVFTWGILSSVCLVFTDLLRQALLPWTHRLLHLLFASAIIMNILYHMKNAAHSSPGFTSEVTAWGLHKENQFGWRWCKHCQRPKPPRAHHCRLCGKCVLLLDHHCPWLNNCIGLKNYRSFFLLIFYITLGCVYSAPWFWRAMRATGRQSTLLPHERSLLLASPVVPVLCFSMTLAGGVACALLLTWHLYLVLTGQTTLEFYSNVECARAQGQKFVNMYNLGWRENFKEAFGVQGQWWWVAWLLPVSPQPRGTGLWFPTIFDLSLWKDPAQCLSQEACEAGSGSPFSPRCSAKSAPCLNNYFGSPGMQ